jgi:tape measure domain-containing protein
MAITVQEAQVLFSADGMQQVNTEAKKAAGAMDGIVSAAKRAGGAMGGIRSAVSGLGGMLSVLGAGAAIGSMVKMAADAETLGTQLKVLTGDAATAQQVMGDIRQFAEATPFQTEEISEAARSLLAFGGNAKTVVDELRMLGDISAGTGTPLKELSELYGKAKVQGRLFAEDINQLTGRGIPIVGALAKQFGVAEGDVRKLVESGAIGFPEMQRALAGMVGPGGQFAGMMQDMSQTTAGRFSTLVDQFKAIGLELGTQILPYANEFMTWIMNTMQGVDGIGAAFGKAIESTKQWFLETQTNLEDLGVAIGVVFASLPSQLSLMLQDVGNWIGDLIDYSIQAGKAIANNLRPSVLLGDEQAMEMPTLEFTPRLSGGVGAEVMAELERVRADRIAAQREAARASQQPAVAAPAANLEFVSQEQTAAAQTMKSAAEQQRTERAGALQTFQRLQDRLQQQDKLAQIAQNQLQAQQQAVTELSSINSNLDNLAALGTLA